MAHFLKKTVNIHGVNYVLCSSGKVFSTRTGLEVKQRLNADGYLIFTVGKNGKRRQVSTHREIAKAFVPNPNNFPVVDHLDNDRSNPAASNLEWCTHQTNISRSYERGSHIGRLVGTKNPKAQLSEDEVIEIRRLYDNGIKNRAEIAKHYKRGWSTINHIVRRSTWKQI